jgi:hypothetical protein
MAAVAAITYFVVGPTIVGWVFVVLLITCRLLHRLSVPPIASAP